MLLALQVVQLDQFVHCGAVLFRKLVQRVSRLHLIGPTGSRLSRMTLFFLNSTGCLGNRGD
jgi:hypothetical protein